MNKILAIGLALLAGTVCAQDVYYVGTGVPQVQQIATEYQTITINEPRIKWRPEVTYEAREVQLSVPEVKLSSLTPAATTVLQTYSEPQTICPTGQCYQAVQNIPGNYVPDSDRGTNVRFEPAMVITEDGDERIIRTPIRSAIAARRLNRTSTFDPDPTSGPSFR